MDDKIEGIVKKMDDDISKLGKFSRENPGILKIIQDDCPSGYGLKDIESFHCGNKCGICWEQALENIKDE